jgi:ABC-type Fe3+-hydroxamate transport system substrate-binding protein
MKLQKLIISLVTAATLFACASPSVSLASSTKLPQVSDEQVADMEKVIDIIGELDRSNLNMENLAENKPDDINKLSADAKGFYYIYAQASEGSEVDTVEALSVIHTAYESMDPTTQTTKQASMSKPTYVAPSSIIGGVKTYKLSNQQVVDIGKLVGVHGAGWGLILAIAKKFAKTPTLATGLIIAVPALGWAVLNACNRYNKGVIIKDIRIGASHNFSCSARK